MNPVTKSIVEKNTFIDLFCGCGGFSLGMKRAGFDCLAAVDFNPEAVAVFRANFPNWFESPIARSYQFPFIGNAVQPLASETVGYPELN